MKKTLFAAAATLTLVSPLAMAGDPDRFEDFARVREVDAQYERVNVPRKECYSEYEPEVRRHGWAGNSLVGPLIGGYRVVYTYAGRTHTRILPYDPGRKLAVNVIVEPASEDRDDPVSHHDDGRFDR